MTPEDLQPRSEREQTDESLRVEREKADHALDERLAAIDEAADAVISRARARADKVIATARAKTDRKLAPSPPTTEATKVIEKERGQEDQTLRQERATADETVREERAEHADLFSIEREETDKDLLSERAKSDDTLATRDEFLGIVSHDLRNMLTAMVGHAQLIAEGITQGRNVGELLMHAQRIQRSGAHMDRLVGDLVDVASIEAGVLAATREIGDPADVVTEAVDTFQAQASAREISLVAEIVPPPSLAAFDSARILQVISNLLSNAIKFTPAKGRIVVKVERIREEIRVSVSDTGVGIRPDMLEAVFGRYLQITDDRQGVGLGLYISKAILQGHGGRIWAESTIGEGSTFHFTLPIHIA